MNTQQNFIADANEFIKKKKFEKKLIVILLFVSLSCFLASLILTVILNMTLGENHNHFLGNLTSPLIYISVFAPGIALLPGFLKFAWAYLRGMPASLKDQAPTYTAYIDDAGNVRVYKDTNFLGKALQVMLHFALLLIMGAVYFFLSVVFAIIKLFTISRAIRHTRIEIENLGGIVTE